MFHTFNFFRESLPSLEIADLSQPKSIAVVAKFWLKILKNQHLNLSSISLEAECGAELSHDVRISWLVWGGLTTCSIDLEAWLCPSCHVQEYLFLKWLNSFAFLFCWQNDSLNSFFFKQQFYNNKLLEFSHFLSRYFPLAIFSYLLVLFSSFFLAQSQIVQTQSINSRSISLSRASFQFASNCLARIQFWVFSLSLSQSLPRK